MLFSRTRLPVAVVATSLLLTLGSWPASNAAPDPDPGTDRATEPAGAQLVRFGTYNIRAGVSTDDFRSAVLALQPRVDLAGLQEVNSKDKQAVLEGLDDWGFFRATRGRGEQNPVMWDEREFTFVHGRTTQTAPPCHRSENVHKEQKPHFVTVVRLVHRDTGQRVVVVNGHLAPGAVKGGRPATGRTELFRCYTAELRNVRAVAVEESAWGQVFTMGDFNAGWVADQRWQRKRLPFRRFLAVNMESMWATERPEGVGTHNDALIDQVFAAERAVSATVETDITYSDHVPGIAGYLLGE